jgi:hypothetical protein
MESEMLRIVSCYFLLLISLTACPIPVIRPYKAALERTPEALVNQPFSTSASLIGQIDGTGFVVSGNYGGFVNDPSAIQSTGSVTAVIVTAPTVSSSTCSLSFTTQTVPPSGGSLYSTLSGQVSGRCDVSGNNAAWLDALNQSKVEVVIKSVNFPNGVVKGTFILQ